MKPITENIIEQSTIEILQSQGWEYANGKELSPEGIFCERESNSIIESCCAVGRCAPGASYQLSGCIRTEKIVKAIFPFKEIENGKGTKHK